MIHTTIGLYPNGEFKVNGVKSENLTDHINYNINMRPGRALILDTFVIYEGIGCKKALNENLNYCSYS